MAPIMAWRADGVKAPARRKDVGPAAAGGRGKPAARTSAAVPAPAEAAAAAATAAGERGGCGGVGGEGPLADGERTRTAGGRLPCVTAGGAVAPEPGGAGPGPANGGGGGGGRDEEMRKSGAVDSDINPVAGGPGATSGPAAATSANGRDTASGGGGGGGSEDEKGDLDGPGVEGADRAGAEKRRGRRWLRLAGKAAALTAIVLFFFFLGQRAGEPTSVLGPFFGLVRPQPAACSSHGPGSQIGY